MREKRNLLSTTFNRSFLRQLIFFSYSYIKSFSLSTSFGMFTLNINNYPKQNASFCYSTQILDVNIMFRINWCTIYNFEHDVKLDAQYKVECVLTVLTIWSFLLSNVFSQDKSIDPLSIWKIQVPATTQQAKSALIYS